MKRYFHIIEFLLSLSLFVGCEKEDINFSHVSQKTNNEVIPGDIKLTDIGYLTDNVIIVIQAIIMILMLKKERLLGNIQ